MLFRPIQFFYHVIHIFDGCKATDNAYGIILTSCNQCVVRNCQSDLNQITGVGEGFTSLAAGGTPAAPGVTNSTFEINHAFRNGNGATHDGVNGNYNIIYNAVPLVWEPLLEVDLNAGTAAPRPINGFPTYFATLHNTSTIG